MGGRRRRSRCCGSKFYPKSGAQHQQQQPPRAPLSGLAERRTLRRGLSREQDYRLIEQDYHSGHNRQKDHPGGEASSLWRFIFLFVFFPE
mmetsp:Transcript_36674/g.63632  ORF Transcript_36674/g.63632 Transcript_36674/m.63632 type:complete len:90 (+) Transcript_36674:233-502(+)